MKRYGVVIADPAWSYTNSSGRLHGTVGETQYSTMTTADICGLPVKDLAAADSVIMLWVTNPKLPDGCRVLEAWGFEFLTAIPWLKVEELIALPSAQPYLRPQMGVGFWFRGCAETLMIGRRGSVPAWGDPPIGLAPGSHLGLASENWGHSRKPNNLYELAERLPGPYLELFARRARAGWDVWGNEAPQSIECRKRRSIRRFSSSTR
jgi:N6-adenosine-specific RNA methylase IME4